MAVNRAPTSLATAPDNSKVAVDVYEEGANNSPLNKLTGLVDKNLSGSIKLGGKFGAKMVGDVLKNISADYAKNGKFDISGAIEKVAGPYKFDKGAFINSNSVIIGNVLKKVGFTGSAAGNILDGVLSAAGGDSLQKMLTGDYTNIIATVNNVEKGIKNLKNLRDLDDFSKLFETMTGNPDLVKVFDVGGVASVLKGMNDTAREFKIPGTIDKYLDILDKGERKEVIFELVKDANMLFDVTFVDNLTKKGDVSTPGILASNPGIVKDILKNLAPTFDYPEASVDLAEKLLGALDRLDPNWKTFKWGDKEVTNLDVFKNASPIVRDSFMKKGMFITEFALADNYEPEDPIAMAKRLYPYCAV